MQFSAMLVGLIAATSTAAFVMPAYPLPEETSNLAKRSPGDFGADLINAIQSFPGIRDINDILKCMKNDEGWEADWSMEDKGIVVFENVEQNCCELTEKAWKKHQKAWSKLGTLIFNPWCNGGKIKDMTPANAKRLHSMLGDHGEK